MKEGEPIEHALVTARSRTRRSKVEGHNFDIRKHLLEYDDVMNQQRTVIYAQRREILTGKNLGEVVMKMTADTAEGIADTDATRSPSPSSGTSRPSRTRASRSSTSGSSG